MRIALFILVFSSSFGVILLISMFLHDRLKKRAKLRAEAEEAAKKKAKEEETKIETWSEDGIRFISVPHAVSAANAAAKKLLLEDAQVKSFAVFCREDLEEHLRKAELSWTMIHFSERNKWMSNQNIVNALAEAVRKDGFEVSHSYADDGQCEGRIFIRVIGRK